MRRPLPSWWMLARKRGRRPAYPTSNTFPYPNGEHPMVRKSILSFATAACLSVGASAASAQSAPQQQQGNATTSLTSTARPQQTQYFTFAQAPTFQVIDQSTNGVILGSQQLCATYG